MRLVEAMIVLLVAITLGACTYGVRGTPTYDSIGVEKLEDYPTNRSYRNLGKHSWGFYRPSFSEPTLASVWEALSEEVRGVGGDACIVRYQKVGGWTARTLTVTCEVLDIQAGGHASQHR